ncbi:(2Fe-2S) ferredoxin domain-containing protein [Gordonia neofelifaecis]|uniref:Ferredoxin-like protein n=1 Tax=Gordonia neofelifaecis NRRL B-59395 TaxID=644548 RepID=F1YL04_9ACTN|nr:(2Fe-2S) ferredoxin domain-containing protein [Gordonia neofelifaecis]EGD54609.1 ferredoxin-like protein [Gordonia neofelifaecis NRRL B-59395]
MIEADWVIVTAPTDRGADPAVVLEPALAVLAARHQAVTFRSAVLGGGSSTVTEVLDDAVRAGAASVMVLSGQTLADRRMDAWFRRVIGHWLRQQPAGTAPEVRIGGSLADAERYADLVEDVAVHGGAAARDTTAPLACRAWEQIPAFSRHVLVCRGPRCSANGAPETQAALTDALEAQALGDDDVLVTLTGCLFPCSQAPVVAVYPDGVWYAGLTADRVATVVEQHLVGGEPIRGWIGERASRP